MGYADDMISLNRPDSIKAVTLPRRVQYYPSPVNWQNEVLYFLLVDRFSDGREGSRPKLDMSDLRVARDIPGGWRWDKWAESGATRWQGGTIAGVTSRLEYLAGLGITAIWLSPVFTQRAHLNTYHGYGIQDFLDVDSRFGTRRELVELVREAHQKKIRIILDIIFNHSGCNWFYQNKNITMPYTAGRYPFGSWRDSSGNSSQQIGSGRDGVWPVEFQDEKKYTRAGSGSLAAGDINDPCAEHKRSDFCDLRDFDLDGQLLGELALCYKYWIALTDCDGFRIDTLKHVSFDQARNFCGNIKEYASNIGKENFFLVGEIAGGDENEVRYLDALDRNLNAALDIGSMRLTLRSVAKGFQQPVDYFSGFNFDGRGMGSHRNQGDKHVSVLDDHDHVCGEKLRFSAGAASSIQVIVPVALQIFTLGIPCIYYGTEQAFSGPESSELKWLPEWGSSDRYLREAMFGPEHPLGDGVAGADRSSDTSLPGFGAFGTSGHHCFDMDSPAYIRISRLLDIRKRYPALKSGRQYLRMTSFLGSGFDYHGPGELIAWSRILSDEEFLIAANPHGTEQRGAGIIVDSGINGGTMTVLVNTEETGNKNYSGALAAGRTVDVIRDSDGKAYVSLYGIGPSEVVILTNKP